MLDEQQQYAQAVPRGAEMDAGLREFFLNIYNYMTSALILTGLVSYFASSSPAFVEAVAGTGLGMVLMFAPLAFILILSFGIHKLSFKQTQMAFWAFAFVMGLSLYYIFLLYTGTSIARVFFITAATFAGMSLFGYTTKKDLTGIGSFLIMGLWGIVIASIVNVFLGSTQLDFIVSILAVVIFTGLIAFETQNLKGIYYVVNGNGEQLGKASIMGALNLYLSFINLFIVLLRLFAQRR